MKRRYTVLFALVATYLVVSVAPIAGAASGDLVVASEHTTTSDFNNATTLQDVTVENGAVTFGGEQTLEGFEDGDL